MPQSIECLSALWLVWPRCPCCGSFVVGGECVARPPEIGEPIILHDCEAAFVDDEHLEDFDDGVAVREAIHGLLGFD